MACVSVPVVAGASEAGAGFAVPAALSGVSGLSAGASTITAAAGGGAALAGGGAAGGIANLGVGLQGLGALTSGLGMFQQGQAGSAAQQYAAQVAANNATIAQQNAQQAGLAGAQQVGVQQQKNKQVAGAIEAGQAGAGVDVGTGSAVTVQQSQNEIGMQDALQIRYNAARTAYGYQTASQSYQQQQQLDNMGASNAATGGDISGASTLLGGAGNAGLNWAKFNTGISGGQ